MRYWCGGNYRIDCTNKCRCSMMMIVVDCKMDISYLCCLIVIAGLQNGWLNSRGALCVIYAILPCRRSCGFIETWLGSTAIKGRHKCQFFTYARLYQNGK